MNIEELYNQRPDLALAKLIGEPINTQFPVPVEITEIADTFTAVAGEHIWRYSSLDTTADVILAVDANGYLVDVRRSPLSDVEVSFISLNSKLERVGLDAILGSPDVDLLARRKQSIMRGMDKREVKLILDAILGKTAGYVPGTSVQEYTVASATDLYDAVMGMKHLVEDYGDNYILLVGSTVSNAIDTYDKDQVGSFNYRIGLKETFRSLGIEVRKIFGQVSSVTGETEASLMDSKKMILIAKDSRISEGKPIKFVRRLIDPRVAEAAGLSVDNAQRAIAAVPLPVSVDVAGTSTNTLDYGVVGYESIIFLITNPYAIVIADMNLVL